MTYHHSKVHKDSLHLCPKAAQRSSQKANGKPRLVVVYFFAISILLIFDMFTPWAVAQVGKMDECAEACSPWRVWSWHPCTCLDDDGDT